MVCEETGRSLDLRVQRRSDALLVFLGLVLAGLREHILRAADDERTSRGGAEISNRFKDREEIGAEEGMRRYGRRVWMDAAIYDRRIADRVRI